MPVKIAGSVGKKGKNKPDDAEKIQKLLNLHKKSCGIGTLKVDKMVGKKTIAAIEAFQKKVAGTKPDGRVDPGGQTIKTLNVKPGAVEDKSPGGKPGADDEEEDDKELFNIETLRRQVKKLIKKPHIFAFGLGANPEDCVLVFKKKGSARKLHMVVKKETGLKKVTFGIAKADPESKQILVLDIEGKLLPGMGKKAKKYLKIKKLLPFKQVKLILEGEEIDDGPDDDEDQTQVERVVASKGAKEKGDEASSASTSTKREYVEEIENWSPDDDLSVGDALELFDQDYMDDVMSEKPKGANSKSLNDAMERLLKKPSAADVKEYLGIFVRETDLTESQSFPQYKKYLVVRKQGEQVRKNKENVEKVPMIDEEKHGDFLGTTANLRFGKVVGDNFGLHPVFGAMLSPTGGLVGGGNSQIPGLNGLLYDPDNPDDPLVKHGIVHDAAGYLYNYHDDGPGYDYLDREDRDTGHEMTGQQSGIKYWYSKENYNRDTTIEVLDTMYAVFDSGGKEVYDLVMKGEIPPEIEKAYEKARKKAETMVDTARDTAEDAYDWADETLEEAAEDIRDAFDKVVDATEAATEAMEDTAKEAYDRTKNAAEEAAEAIEESAGEAADWVSDKASDAADTVEKAAEATWEAANDAYDYADEAVDDALDFLADLW